MAKNKLSALAFINIKPTDKEQLVSDGEGLYVRVRSKKDGGAKSFRVVYRLNGKQRWISLISTGLPDARAERDKIKEQVSRGLDPSLERELETERKHQAQLAEQAEIARQAAVITVRDLFERWAEIDLINRKDGGAEVRRMFEKDVLPVIGDLVVTDVRKGHITAVIDKLLKRGVNRMGKLIFSLMRQMFRFAVERDILEFDPSAAIKKSKIGGKDVERDRVLSQDEIVMLHNQMPDARFMPTTEAAIWIMLSTCCRVGEISKARWEHIDLEKYEWVIPPENSKSGKPHTIFLSNFAARQFKTLEQFKCCEWMYPNRDKSNHVSEKSISKQVNGRQNPVILKGRSQHNESLVLPGGRWTPHDLRRTGATLMSELGVLTDVIEKCLNHAEQNKMKRVYQRHEYKAEQAAAWRVLGERLELLTGERSNVIDIKHRLAKSA